MIEHGHEAPDPTPAPGRKAIVYRASIPTGRGPHTTPHPQHPVGPSERQDPVTEHDHPHHTPPPT